MTQDLKFVDVTPVKNEVYTPGTGVAIPASPVTPDQAAGVEGDSFFGRMKSKFLAIKKYKDERFASLRPWSEFFDRSKFSAPGKLEAFSRINKNLSTFYSNYVVVTFLISLYVLFSNFLFLTAMVCSFAAYYWVKMQTANGEPLVIRGKEFSATQANVSLVFFTIFMFLYTNGSSTVFWLVTMALLAVFGHAAAREPVQDASGSAFAAVGSHVFV
jgi:hypothetical protein